jgi:hypothetical protein
MPTIKDAERVANLNTERQLLRYLRPLDLEVTISSRSDDYTANEFKVKHLAGELLDLLRRERDAQIAAIEAEIVTLGFELEELAEPTEPEEAEPAPAA